MQKLKPFPYATLTLVLIMTIIQVLRSIGGNYGDMVWNNLVVTSWENHYSQPWRILTSPFVHQNLLHYLENFLFLVLFGWSIERKHGWKILLGVFFGALVTGYVVWINLAHNWIIGISGGVYGLFGFSLIANRRSPWWTTLTHRPLHLLYTLNLIWAVIVDSLDILPFEVAHLNHVVGILYGLGFGTALILIPQKKWSHWVVYLLPIVLFASQFYSPWQLEWQMVNSQPILFSEDADCRLQSEELGTLTSSSVKFQNNSAKAIALYWLDYEGQAQFYSALRPGNSYELLSYIGHPWCFIDSTSGEALQSFTVTEEEHTVTYP